MGIILSFRMEKCMLLCHEILNKYKLRIWMLGHVVSSLIATLWNDCRVHWVYVIYMLSSVALTEWHFNSVTDDYSHTIRRRIRGRFCTPQAVNSVHAMYHQCTCDITSTAVCPVHQWLARLSCNDFPSSNTWPGAQSPHTSMASERAETVIDLPWDVVDACNGFGIDIG